MAPRTWLCVAALIGVGTFLAGCGSGAGKAADGYSFGGTTTTNVSVVTTTTTMVPPSCPSVQSFEQLAERSEGIPDLVPVHLTDTDCQDATDIAVGSQRFYNFSQPGLVWVLFYAPSGWQVGVGASYCIPTAAGYPTDINALASAVGASFCSWAQWSREATVILDDYVEPDLSLLPGPDGNLAEQTTSIEYDVILLGDVGAGTPPQYDSAWSALVSDLQSAIKDMSYERLQAARTDFYQASSATVVLIEDAEAVAQDAVP